MAEKKTKRVKPIPVRQTRLELLYGAYGVESYDKNIENIMPDLLDFTYSDKESGEADEISITLKDETGKWAKNWQTEARDAIKARILEGDIDGARKALYCGKFYVDEMGCSGAPRVFSIKAVSLPFFRSIRRAKTRSWEKQRFSKILKYIATESHLEYVYDCAKDILFNEQQQNNETDFKFLSRLCEQAKFSLKVTSSKIVVFDQASYEKKKPVKTLTLGVDNILDYSFTMDRSETYKSCTVSYHDGKENETHKVTAFDSTVDDDGQEYAIKEVVGSKHEASRMAEAKLRELNSRRVTGSLTVVGDVLLVSGAVIECRGFGKVDGNFIIESAEHKIGNGYTTSLEIRRTNTKY